MGVSAALNNTLSAHRILLSADKRGRHRAGYLLSDLAREVDFFQSGKGLPLLLREDRRVPLPGHRWLPLLSLGSLFPPCVAEDYLLDRARTQSLVEPRPYILAHVLERMRPDTRRGADDQPTSSQLQRVGVRGDIRTHDLRPDQSD
jgi:hypothetical protein